MPIRCEIVSQDRTVFEDDVDIVVLPGMDGEMGILPHHAPLLTPYHHSRYYAFHTLSTSSESAISLLLLITSSAASWSLGS